MKWVFYIIFVFNTCNCLEKISNKEYDLLPKVFELTDYYKCKEDNKVYCKVDIKLSPKNTANLSESWKLIQRMNKSYAYFNHDKLHHGICLDRSPQDDDLELIGKEYTTKYSDIGLNANVIKVYCFGQRAKIIAYDYLVLAVLFAIIFVVGYTTYTDYLSTKEKRNDIIENKYLAAFSLIRNYNNVMKTGSKKFLFLEGMRFYTMIVVVCVHSFSSYATIYIKNTEYMENLFLNGFKHGLFNYISFVVQTFFVVSAVLLTIQILELHKSNNEFTFYNAVVLLINRFFRLLPSLAMIVAFHASNWPRLYSDGVLRDIVDTEYENCKNNWWITLLLINNQIRSKFMCNSGAWYLSVDTQLYAATIFLLYVALKFRFNIKKLVVGIGILSILYNGLLIYLYNYPVIYSMLPRRVSFTKFIPKDAYIALYMSTYSNIATYMIGVGCGCWYVSNKNTNLFKSQVQRAIWWLAVTCLPIGAVYLTLFEYPLVVRAIIGALVKPLYSLGIAISIYGLLTNINGIAKKVCEWKPAVLLASFTYSTYLYHFGPVLAKTASIKDAVYLSDFVIVSSMVKDCIAAFASGIAMYFLVECPAAEIQKYVFPKVKRRKLTEEKKIE